MTTTETEVKEETPPEEEEFDYSKVEEIIESLPQKSRRHLIPVLQRVQGAYRYLPEEAMTVLMEELNISRAEIYGVISFYPGLMITEPGKYILKVCVGTACFVKGCEIICNKVDEQYHIKVGETDEKKLFTLQTASCMGNCGAAPILVVGDDFYGNLDPEETLSTLGSYEDKE